ncbi:hypothetical protein WICPIJ_001872 [Wickerhamomyces pijperi]|uniref:Uncharacterized protein n=1 Tax=Wickerhamomyces pijperi TaxID=599730 RepID=A0A9P8QAU0_WICPI|nr:hypothetical protein WICPIJ_001872 [Wickerhamomyces pijperi]
MTSGIIAESSLDVDKNKSAITTLTPTPTPISSSIPSAVPLQIMVYDATPVQSSITKNSGYLHPRPKVPSSNPTTFYSPDLSTHISDLEGLNLDDLIEREICRLYEDYYELSHGQDPEHSLDSVDLNSAGDFKGIPSLTSYSDTIDREESIIDQQDSERPRSAVEDSFEDCSFPGMKKPLNKYILNHQYWVPSLDSPDQQTSRTDYKVNNIDQADVTSDHFFSYLHSQPQLSDAPMPSLYLHTSTTLNSNIYVIGGLRPIFTNKSPSCSLEESLKGKIRISKDGWIQYPTPLNSEMLNSVSMIPNDVCYVVSLQSNVIRRVNLSEVYERKTQVEKQKGGSYSEHEDSTVMLERGLVGMTGNSLSERYVLYFGGFVLKRSVEKVGEILEVSFKIHENQFVYVLDVYTFQFQKFGLFTHDHRANLTLNSGLESAHTNAKRDEKTGDHKFMSPRFGHTSNAVNLSQPDQESSVLSDSTSAIYVIGGLSIQQDDQGCYSYQILKDIWKLEMTVKAKGKNHYLVFGDKVLASEVVCYQTDPNIIKQVSIQDPETFNKIEFGEPEERAFHITELLDTSVVFGEDDKYNIFNKTANIVSRLRTAAANVAKLGYLDASTVRNQVIFSNERKTQLKLLMHGGVNRNGEILGDIWWFDFEQEMWFRFRSYFNEYQFDDSAGSESEFQMSDGILQPISYEEVQLKKCDHHSFVFDKFLVLVYGAIPSDFPSSLPQNKCKLKDISELFIRLKDTQTTSRYQPQPQHHQIFLMNIWNQKWFVYKLFHKMTSRVCVSSSDLSNSDTAKNSIERDHKFNVSYTGCVGGTATVVNSKLLYIGGLLIDCLDKAKQHTTDRELIMNNGIICIELPLGGFSSWETVNKSKY